MSRLRQAANRAVIEWEKDDEARKITSLDTALDNLRTALFEPDPVAEAVELVKQLVKAITSARQDGKPIITALEIASVATARDWLAKHDTEGK